MPLPRKTRVTGTEDDDAADDGTGGIAIAKRADGLPGGFLVAVGPGGGAPESEGDGVCRGGAAAVAEMMAGLQGRAFRWERGGPKAAVANGAGRWVGSDAVEGLRSGWGGGALRELQEMAAAMASLWLWVARAGNRRQSSGAEAEGRQRSGGGERSRTG